ncbi:hypothetical protein [Methylobacterium oxalidis]|uniref:Helix-turn-helix domain-containing protein n=1 Tax=Methylobacterium oxalidis TaxID=944322 RepID=A0A512JBA4_9HYPH|nr:hypothetical protein [Methylobacterium oxalidis]GEP07216.1 hypothetical protein MOX02_52540 [Methylobacterium oxalidis]GJE31922.1 hypothetical protein LDDCCGHA_2104 [Methylobacterium oxalidis]GLS67634.1 hypothetical protein GCM10007888_60180 [Methylobacterium oxalidis]
MALASAQANTAMLGFITIKQFAAMANLSVRQVWRLNAAGRTPQRVKHGHWMKYRRSEAEASLAQRQARSRTP